MSQPSDRHDSASPAEEIQQLKAELERAEKQIQAGKRKQRRLGLTVAVAVLLVVLVLAGSIGWIMRDREYRRRETEKAVSAAVAEARRLLEEKKTYEALGAARRAEALLGGGDVDGALRKRVEQMLRDIKMLRELEEAYNNAEMKGGNPDLNAVERELQKAFRDWGFDVARLVAIAKDKK